ncbi:MAG TPA: hypothetical protein VHW60_23755 [Caulobacteraceae bacterium]|jgi:hypothetical protein|nr:hypothetical protein [Caulobacteraceae bacterium]
MKTVAPPPLASHAPAVQFRGEIEKAEADGVARADLLLKLTIGDANKLKRDNSLAITDISFADGVMWFLGVKTEQGGVAVSSLQRP